MGEKRVRSKGPGKKRSHRSSPKKKQQRRGRGVGERAEKVVPTRMSHLRLVEANGGNWRDSVSRGVFSAAAGGQAACGTATAGSQHEVTGGRITEQPGSPREVGTFRGSAGRPGDQSEGTGPGPGAERLPRRRWQFVHARGTDSKESEEMKLPSTSQPSPASPSASSNCTIFFFFSAR